MLGQASLQSKAQEQATIIKEVKECKLCRVVQDSTVRGEQGVKTNPDCSGFVSLENKSPHVGMYMHAIQCKPF
jgi:repressor of nif and glnA expression